MRGRIININSAQFNKRYILEIWNNNSDYDDEEIRYVSYDVVLISEVNGIYQFEKINGEHPPYVSIDTNYDLELDTHKLYEKISPVPLRRTSPGNSPIHFRNSPINHGGKKQKRTKKSKKRRKNKKTKRTRKNKKTKRTRKNKKHVKHY